MSSIVQNILKEFQLPHKVTNEDGEGFDDFFEQYLQNFIHQIDSIPTPVIFPDGSNVGVRTDVTIKSVTEICQGLTEILHIYLKGFPSTSYEFFEKLVDEYSLGKQLLRLRIQKINKRTPFYRAQVYHKKPLPFTTFGHTWTPDDPVELFHPPFNKRKRVGPNRFSIPGYPCLYVSDKLKTSYREASQEKTEVVSAICLRNNRPLYIADISPIVKKYLDNKSLVSDINYTNELLTYSVIFPLIAASHFKIVYKEEYNNEVKFKVEYIIPQLLLQWFQKNARLFIDGIKYLSCSVAFDPAWSGEDDYNYILTTEENKPEKVCPKLSKLFNVSPVLFINPAGAADPDKIMEESEKELSGAIVKPF